MATSHHYRGTICIPPPERHYRAPRRPQWPALRESHPRTAVDVHLAIRAAFQATAWGLGKPDQPLARASFLPSQLLLNESLRRPVEFTQYLAIRYSERLAEEGIDPSVGSVGDSYDNAMAESIIGLFKAEVIRPKGPSRGLDAVEYATLEWVEWFNNRRLLGPIGDIPPVELETAYYDKSGSSSHGGWTQIKKSPEIPGWFSYTLREWDHLTAYLEHSVLTPDNNAALS